MDSILPALAVAADVGGSFVKVARASQGDLVEEPSRHAMPASDWPAFCATLRLCCEGVPSGAPLSLSIAGTVEPDSGRAFAANIPCINGRALASELAAALERPVLVANDADCFVLAEARQGAAVGARVVFGIVLGTGVGGGLVVDGQLVPGAGEWGHGPVLGVVTVGPVSIPPLACGCGQVGCLDTLGSARGLVTLDRLIHGRERTSRDLLAAWASGEPLAATTVAAWVDLLSGPLAMVVNATGASILPVAGGLGNDHALVSRLDEAVRRRVLRRFETPLVVPSSFGDAAGLIGAAIRASLPP